MNNIGLLLAFVLLLGTVWLAIARFQTKPDTSWPLVYYFMLVAFLNAYELVLNPNVVYVAVVCALLLRFEFLNERLIFFVKIIEFSTLVHIGYRLGTALMKAVR
jgi:hypothetical protein